MVGEIDHLRREVVDAFANTIENFLADFELFHGVIPLTNHFTLFTGVFRLARANSLRKARRAWP